MVSFCCSVMFPITIWGCVGSTTGCVGSTTGCVVVMWFLRPFMFICCGFHESCFLMSHVPMTHDIRCIIIIIVNVVL